MKGIRWIVLLSMMALSGSNQTLAQDALEVTYIANEGFMISMGRTKFLIDPLPRSKYYANPTDTLRTSILHGCAPYDSIDYVLVTHEHADHFHAETMSQYLSMHPSVQFVGNRNTCRKAAPETDTAWSCIEVDLIPGKARNIRRKDAEIQVVRLEHGGDSEISNLAYLIRSNGYTVVHVGDAKLSANETHLRALDWKRTSVDILFLEFFDQSDQTREIIQKLIRPKHVILMHIAPGEEDQVRVERSGIHPRSVVFDHSGETKRFSR